MLYINYSAITSVVNNYNTQTEPRFLTRTEPNLFRTERQVLFWKTEPKPNGNKNIYSAHPYPSVL